MNENKDIKKIDNVANGTKKPAKLKEEAKVGLVVTLSAVLFFGGIITIASLQKGGGKTSVTIPSNSVIGDVSKSSEEPVVDVYDPMKEVVTKPFATNVTVTIARTFYDSADDEETRLTALVNLPGEENVYSKSFGVDYKSTQKFNVYASFSGAILRKVNDATYGNVVYLKHDSGIVSVYCSLGEVNVNEGQAIKQGDLIGSSGESLYTSTFGQSLHFELRNDAEEHINPNKAYGVLVKNL